MTPLTPEHKAAIELAERHVALEGSLRPEESLLLARALLDRNTEVERNQRQWDLIRYQRSELHTAGLITDDEYAELAKDHAAVQRLEDYDAVRTELSALRTRLETAGKDTTRLDWLENTWVDDESSPLTEYEGQWHADGMPNGPMADDMRAAIDAAMSATQPEPEPSGNTGELPVCPTCNGKQEVTTYTILDRDDFRQVPCPDCSAPQPATGQTAQPRIWRMSYPAQRPVYSDDNGVTWTDEQTAAPSVSATQEPK
jgi:hypothetical protein